MAPEHAALQVLHHCQLPQWPDLHDLLLLRQPRAVRRAAGHGAQPSLAAHQPPRLLRGQAEKASKTQAMYEKRVGGWLEWEDVQKSRVSAMQKLEGMGDGGTPAAKRNLLRDCCALSLLSLIPPDRVGCIRKLRLGHTLKKKASGGCG